MSVYNYKILKQEGRAKRAEVTTIHGTIQTPVFMNVGTVAAIKGAVSTEDLQGIKTQVELSNTYHLHVRPRAYPSRFMSEIRFACSIRISGKIAP